MWQFMRVSFSGRLNQKSYVICFVSQFIMSMVVLIAGSVLLEVIGADASDATDTMKLGALIVSIFASTAFLYAFVAMLGSIARRANDTSHFYLWLAVGLLAPFGIAILAFVPSAKK